MSDWYYTTMDLLILLGLLLGLAIVDSINPSALLVTGYLLKAVPEKYKARSIVSYVAGIFCFYFISGILLLLGISFLSSTLGPVLESTAAYILQAIIGLALFIWAWIPPKPVEQTRLHPKAFNPLTLFVLGITVTLVEFSTALPYLGAITLLQEAQIAFGFKAIILFIYNIIFILPPLGLLAFYTFNQHLFEKWQAARLAKRGGKPDDTMQWIAGIVGAMLFLNALEALGMKF